MKLNKSYLTFGSLLASAALLTACGGNSSDNGGDNSGARSLVAETTLLAGNEHCFKGGVKVETGRDLDGDNTLTATEVESIVYECIATELNSTHHFVRTASFPVCSQIDAQCNTDAETAAEIVAASSDGSVLIYTDSPAEQVGFVDINDPASPTPLGTLALNGEPTSVAVNGNFALVAVNTSVNFVDVSGQLDVVNIATRLKVTSLDLGGQPDSIAVSPDGHFAAVVIENERDEDLGDGAPPQLPAGGLVIVDISDANPDNWTSSNVDLTGLSTLFPGDPEPEYVDINNDNIAVVTLQENNHIVLVDLNNGSIVNHFSAGSVDLTQIDLTEGKPLSIEQSESQNNVVREPDGVSWINNQYFATADEGDLDGGSRGFTIFNLEGEVVWTAGSSLDHRTARFGHYPDKRSGNKGNEPENVELGIFGSDRYLFVNSERSSLVFVYDAADPKNPLYKQTLPAAAGPEGGLAIPARNLLVVASEEDSRGDKLRSVINIYEYRQAPSAYPTMTSGDRLDGTPIPWAAMSGLSSDPVNPNTLYAVEDSFFKSNRIFTIDVSSTPAQVTAEMRLMDTNDVFASYPAVALADTSVDADHATRLAVFDEADLLAMINDDKSVNIDPEGISKSSDGGFWVVSEGNGTIGDDDRPINSLNLLFKTDRNGVIEDVIALPAELNDEQLRFGFEGVAEYNGKVVVAFQRAWEGDAHPRIGIYNPADSSWSFVFYPLDAVESQNGGWVGLSDITSLGSNRFLVLERDNQGGPDAAIKRLYSIDLTSAVSESVLSKTLVRDLMTDLALPGGLTPEKVEGTALMSNGDVYIINDNDGVDDNSGETQLINLGNIMK